MKTEKSKTSKLVALVITALLKFAEYIGVVLVFIAIGKYSSFGIESQGERWFTLFIGAASIAFSVIFQSRIKKTP